MHELRKKNTQVPYIADDREEESEGGDCKDNLHVALYFEGRSCHQSGCNGATKHGRKHKSSKDESMRDIFFVRAQSWGPKKDKGIHGALKQ
jgi:hypothetical protein